MKNKKCHIIGKVPKSKWKTRNATLSEQAQIPSEKQKMPPCRNSSRLQVKTTNITLSEQYQNQIVKSQKKANPIPVAHKYMTVHFPGLVMALQ